MTKGRSNGLIAALAAITVAALVWLGIVRPQQLRENETRAAALDVATSPAGNSATDKEAADKAGEGKAVADRAAAEKAAAGKAAVGQTAVDKANSGAPGAPPADAAARTGEARSPAPSKQTPSEQASAGQAPSGQAPSGQAPAAGEPKADKAAGAPVAPSFDVVRVEPSGEAVLAGRSVPGATIELLRDGEPYARAIADMSGLFAVVPPALPPGPHEIVLQSIAPDGARTQSRQSVTIVIAKNRDTRPLVALASPDKPTVVLSRPETPETAGDVPGVAPKDPKVAENPAGRAAAGESGVQAAPPAGQAARARAPVKIVSVEAEQGGRLLVSGSAAPGATVRLYLNDGFVAPGGVGPDGKLSYMIERGMRPGDYRVRLDDVDPVSGDVKTRAEVNFVVPAGTEPGQVQSARRDAGASAQERAMPQAGSAEQAGAPQKGSAISGRLNEPGQVVIPSVNTAIVARGDNLWSISKRIYGQGVRYTVIYGANQGQIRNPSLIYPGQIFLVPQESSEAGEPRRQER